MKRRTSFGIVFSVFLLLSVLVLFSAKNVRAEDLHTYSNNVGSWTFYVTASTGKATITTYSGINHPEITIPTTVYTNGYSYTVEAIGDGSNSILSGNTSVTKVTIPGGIKYIRQDAFYGSSKLETVVIQSGVTSIGNNAFSSCSNLSSVTIPNSVTSMDTFVFNNCPKMKTAGPLNNASGTTFNLMYGWTTVLPKYAFHSMTYLTSVSILSSIESYGYGSFGNCSGLSNIPIPSTIKTIEEGAFYGCTGVSNFTISSSNTYYKVVDGVLFTKAGDILIAYPAGKTASSYTIPSGVTRIAGEAFQYAKLTTLTIPEGVAEVGRTAFFHCDSLTQLLFPNTLTKLQQQAVSYCSKLSFVVAPNSIMTIIGDQTFKNCAANIQVAVVEDSKAYQYCQDNNIDYVMLPKVVTDPVDWQGELNSSATFKVTTKYASSYQWQYCLANGSTWTNLSNATSSSVSVALKESVNGRKYRCKVTNSYGSTYSAPATLKIYSKPIITSSPDSSLSVKAGDLVTLSVEAHALGATNLSYQWQVSKDGGSTFTNVNVAKFPSAQTATLTFNATRTMNGYEYRVKIMNSYGDTYSNSTVLSVSKGVKITTQPSDNIVKPNDYASFTVTATGSNLKYKWQVSKDYGSTWTDVNQTKYPSAATATLKFKAKDTLNGYWYRCKVYNSYDSTTSASAVLVVSAKPYLISHSSDLFANLGETVTFKVLAANATSYQWYYSKNGGASWTKWTGKTSSSVSVKASKTNNACLYRCKISNENGYVYSGASLLIVMDIAPKIIDQPVAKTVNAGQEVSFSVYATGLQFTYRWQVSKDGGKTWKNISQSTYPSAGWSTLTFTAKSTMNGYLYRCIVDNGYGTIKSEGAKLTVK